MKHILIILITLSIQNISAQNYRSVFEQVNLADSALLLAKDTNAFLSIIEAIKPNQRLFDHEYKLYKMHLAKKNNAKALHFAELGAIKGGNLNLFSALPKKEYESLSLKYDSLHLLYLSKPGVSVELKSK